MSLFFETLAFVLAATALLGSPGPGIAALVAVGRSFPRAAAIRFYSAMQIGLALAAAVSALGVASLVQSSPLVHTTLLTIGSAYLLWLAWTMATAPLGTTSCGDGETGLLTSRAAFLLGVANPKAYLAFASLLGSFTLLPQHHALADGIYKWALCVVVMIIADFAWLALGIVFGRVTISAGAEKAINVLMAATIVVACVTSWF